MEYSVTQISCSPDDYVKLIVAKCKHEMNKVDDRHKFVRVLASFVNYYTDSFLNK